MEIQDNNLLLIDGNDVSHPDYWQKIIDRIKINNYKVCLFLCQGEYALPGDQMLYKVDNFEDLKIFCKSNQIEFYILFGAIDENYYQKIKNLLDNIKILHFPTFYLHLSYHLVMSPYQGKFIEHRNPIDKLYLLLNNNPHYHRQLLMEELCKNNLMECGIQSWNILTKDYFTPTDKSLFNCWNEQILNLDGFKTGVGPYGGAHDASPIYWETASNVLINLVSESNTECQFITEKTWKPIMSGQIFLCYGSVNQNKILTNYGFVLYDELFNYDFDEFPDPIERCKGVIENLKKLKDRNYNELLNQVKPKIEFNIRRAYEIINHDPFVPIELKKLYSLNTEVFNDRIPFFFKNLLK